MYSMNEITPKEHSLKRHSLKGSIKSTVQYTDVPCPFCGLLCDDLVIQNNEGVITAEKNACPKAVKEFNRSVTANKPKINGKNATLEDAIKTAAAILKQSKQPLFAGLGTDVNGMRSVMDIADQTRGVVDHMQGARAAHNFKVLQDRGWINTTLMEVKNRADLIILAGTDTSAFPRFFERMIQNKNSLFSKNLENRLVIYLGDSSAVAKLTDSNGLKIRQLKCKISQVGEVLAATNSLIAGAKLQAKKVAGVRIQDIVKLAEQMKIATYGVIVWSTADLNWEHADLTVQSICRLVEELNKTTRFAGLPLDGSEGGTTAASVCAWQSGYPLRTSFGRGHPEHDTLRFAADNILARNEADALVWISSISAGIQPPATDIPTIALTEPEMQFKQTPAVHIPVGTPGIDHTGYMIRCDNVVSHSLHQLQESDLPRVSLVLNSIQQAI